MSLKHFNVMLICLAVNLAPSGVLASTIPAAEYYSTIWFKMTNALIESRKAGSISYDYHRTYVNFNGETVNDQYVASVALTGEPLPTVDAHGDYQVAYAPGEPEGWATGSIRYYFAVTKKLPNAPDTPVPFSIRASGHVSATKKGPGGESPTAEVKVRYKHPLSTVYENLLFINVSTSGNSTVTQDRSFEGLRAQAPGLIGTIDVVAQGTTKRSYLYKTGAFQAIADPSIEIDPAFTVIVDGVERLGSEVYGLEFSEGIGSGIPEPATAWLAVFGWMLIVVRGVRSRRAGRAGFGDA